MPPDPESAGNESPEMYDLIELKRRSTEEIICHHLGMINASLASIAGDLRIIRLAAEEQLDAEQRL